MGACTFTKATPGDDVVGNKRIVEGTLTLSSSYATGGDTLNLATLVGLKTLDDMRINAGSGVTIAGGYQIKLGGTPAAPTIQAYGSTNAEVAAATNLSTKSFNVRLHGTC